jgi:hypothetical protein
MIIAGKNERHQPDYSNPRDDRRCTMSSVRMCVSTDDRIRNGARWARIKRSAGLGLLSAAVVGSITPFAAESADDLRLPASFRNWYHVNTMVIDKGSPLAKPTLPIRT